MPSEQQDDNWVAPPDPNVPDKYGSGIVWAAVPKGRSKKTLTLGVWVAPRFLGPKGPGSAEDRLHHRFDDWPRILKLVKKNHWLDGFKVVFRAPDGSTVTKSTKLNVAHEIETGEAQAAWRTLFTGNGPFGSKLAEGGAIDMKPRVTTLAPDLTPEMYLGADKNWHGLLVPNATTTYSAATLTTAMRTMSASFHLDCLGETADYGGLKKRRLMSLAIEESWALPRRTRRPASHGAIGTAMPDDLQRLADVGKSLRTGAVGGGLDATPSQQAVAMDILKDVATALSRYDNHQPPDPVEVAKAGQAHRDGRVQRNLHRLGWSDIWPKRTLDQEVSIKAWLAPVLHRVSSQGRPSGKKSDEIRLALGEAHAFFKRTDLQPEPEVIKALDGPPTWAGYDFFERLSIVQGYRGLLRPIGLLFDLEITDSDNIPPSGELEVKVPGLLAPSLVLPTRTAYVLGDDDSGIFRAAARKSGGPANLRNPVGASEKLLAGGLLRIGGEDFHLETLDHDHVAHRMTLTAETHEDLVVAEARLPRPGLGIVADQVEYTAAAKAIIDGVRIKQKRGGLQGAEDLGLDPERLLAATQRLLDAAVEQGARPSFPPGTALLRTWIAASKDKRVPVWVRPQLDKGQVTALAFVMGESGLERLGRSVASHPRRGAGFSLLWRGHDALITERRRREAAHEANRVNPGYVVLDEQDLIAGFAPEVRMCWPAGNGGTQRSEWISLCERQESFGFFGGNAYRAVAPLDPAVFQSTDLAPGQTLPPPEDHVAPALFSWSGGLLSYTPNKPELRAPDDGPGEPKDSWVKLSTSTGAARPLLYSTPDATGRTPYYEFRVRALSRANHYLDRGWEPPSEETSEVVVGAPLLREEPMAAPRVLMPLGTAREVADHALKPTALEGGKGATGTPGERQSWDRRSPGQLVVSNVQRSDTRWVVPNRASLDLCSRYGVFEHFRSLGEVGSFTDAWLDPETGEFPPLGDFDAIGRVRQDKKGVSGGGPAIFQPGVKGAPIKTPYLPDPAMRSFALEIRDETDPGVLLDPAKVLLIPMYPAGSTWPRARAFRIVAQAVFPTKGDRPPAWRWDAKQRLLSIDLVPGQVTKVRLSASPAESLEDSELYRARQFAVHRDVTEGKDRSLQERFERWICGGGNPETSLKETLVLSHAVATPRAPVLRALHLCRNDGDLRTDARVNFAIDADARTVGQVELAMSWSHPVDDPAKSEPEVREGGLTCDPLTVEDPAVPVVDVDLKLLGPDVVVDAGQARFTSSPTSPLLAPFRDTRRHQIRCRAIAKSRFQTWCPPETQGPFLAASSDVIFDVPSSAPPPPVEPAYVLPTFGFETRSRKEKGQTVFESRRHGGGVRVYIERGMYRSGGGERVGVLLLERSSWSHAARPAIEHLVTRWGADPLHGDSGYAFSPEAEDFLNGELVSGVQLVPNKWSTAAAEAAKAARERGNPRDDGFSTIWKTRDPGPICPLELVEQPDLAGPGLKFQMMAFDPTYDPETRRWWFDIALRTGATQYFPFVRFALVRYQPVSLDGMHLSKAVRLDFVQPAPDRAVTVTRLKNDRRSMRLVITGPDRRGAGSVPGVRANQFNVMVKQRIHDREGWIDDKSVQVTIKPGQGPELAEIVLRFPDPIGQRQIVVTETEHHRSAALDPEGRGRIIYSDVLEMRSIFAWF